MNTKWLAGVLAGAAGILVNLVNVAAADAAAPGRIPVILDADIGDDIDDTWALGLLLKCPEFEVKLVVGDHGKNLYRAKIVAKFLEAAGRVDIPIGIGLDANRTGEGPQAAWVKDYDLNAYRGKILPDGVGAIVQTIMRSPGPVTLIAIGPMPNVKEALAREPRIAQRARLVGMHGSVRRGYGGKAEVEAEYNVKEDPKACQAAFTAAWPITITPLDTCGLVDLDGERYAAVAASKEPVARAIVENYRLWAAAQARKAEVDAPTKSSILFDTVAVYLAMADGLAKIETLGIRVTDDGFTRIESGAKAIRVATEWRDLAGFRDFLVRRLTGPSS